MKKKISVVALLVFSGIFFAGYRRHKGYSSRVFVGVGPYTPIYVDHNPWSAALTGINTALLADAVSDRRTFDKQVKKIFDQIHKALEQQGKSIVELQKEVAYLKGRLGVK